MAPLAVAVADVAFGAPAVWVDRRESVVTGAGSPFEGQLQSQGGSCVRRQLVLASASLAIALVAAGCGGKSSSSGSSAPASSPAATTAAAGATVAVKGSKLGRILVDGSGRTLYLFERDKGSTSTCSGACATGWPPLLTSGAPQSGSGVSASLLGTTTRSDGKTEVTYHGHPLYHFAGDGKPGDTNGQGVKAFGAEWYVLSAAGNKVEKEGS